MEGNYGGEFELVKRGNEESWGHRTYKSEEVHVNHDNHDLEVIDRNFSGSEIKSRP